MDDNGKQSCAAGARRDKETPPFSEDITQVVAISDHNV
jgi:hypothetical protein